MKPRKTWLSRAVLPLLAATTLFSCQRPDYRIEVTPGAQGETEIHRVPYTPEERAAQQREAQVRAALARPEAMPPTTAAATPTPTTEPGLAALESLWPKLSPADRAAVLEMAKRAAAKSD